MTAVTTLADLTTLRVGGPPRDLVVADDESTLIDAVRTADASGTPALVVAGGSNLLVADEGYPGTVVLVRSRGVEVASDTCGGAWVTVAAGEPWDGLVRSAMAQEWSGIEALSGIPGSVGATPIQNVGAYGQEVSDVVARVRTWDRHDSCQRTFAAADCGFGYRTSRFKAEPGRYVILEVAFTFPRSATSRPLRHGELTQTLGLSAGGRAPLQQVRDAVLTLRGGKGMVLEESDHDTWSAGSFFTNPVVDAATAAALPAQAPRFDAGAGLVKTSAAWLIDNAEPASLRQIGHAAVSSKHVLALTNRGGASAAEIAALAREVRRSVQVSFGITLEPEPTLVGISLDW